MRNEGDVELYSFGDCHLGHKEYITGIVWLEQDESMNVYVGRSGLTLPDGMRLTGLTHPAMP